MEYTLRRMCRVPDGLPLPLVIFRTWFLVCASVAFIAPLHADPVPATVEEFIDHRCSSCHNDEDRKGNLDLGSLVFDPAYSIEFA